MQTEEGRNGEEEEAGPEGKDDYLFGRGPSVIYFMPHQSEYLATRRQLALPWMRVPPVSGFCPLEIE